MATTEKDLLVGDVSDIIKVEKNLETLGFFTPSSGALKGVLTKKSSLTVKRNGEKLKLSVTISSPPEYGLPITRDFDMYRAFQKLLHMKLINDGQITNPITFKSNQLIKLMGKENQRCQGRYKEIEEWLDRMVAITIDSRGVIYSAGEKKWLSDIFHVFERVVTYGEKLDGKTYADQNYVWLGSWYLENLNFYYLKTIDFEYHKSLRRPLAKSLYALLDIGFFANKRRGYYHKNYAELCEFLSITKHLSLSLIKQQLDPAHQELKDKGEFLARWEYKSCKNGKGYNILWYPGKKFFEDQKTREDRKQIVLDFPRPRVEASPITGQAGDLVRYFQKKLNSLDNYKPARKELAQAQEVLEKCSGDPDRARGIVDYAIQEMKKTRWFDVKYFGAVMKYVDEGLQAFEKTHINRVEAEKKKTCTKCKGTGFVIQGNEAVPCDHK